MKTLPSLANSIKGGKYLITQSVHKLSKCTQAVKMLSSEVVFKLYCNKLFLLTYRNYQDSTQKKVFIEVIFLISNDFLSSAVIVFQATF